LDGTTTYTQGTEVHEKLEPISMGLMIGLTASDDQHATL
jgi:hypothetical protein